MSIQTHIELHYCLQQKFEKDVWKCDNLVPPPEMCCFFEAAFLRVDAI